MTNCSPPSPRRTGEESGSIYVPVDCEILSVTDLSPTEKLFRLRPPRSQPLGHLPGQFVQVSLLGLGEAPISVASSPTRADYFELGVRRAGTVTGAMHRLGAGDAIGIRGPFGNPFDLPRLRGCDLLLISGGCGLAPMRSLIQYCQDRPEEFGGITILYGAKSPRDILFRSDFEVWENLPGFACTRTVDHATEAECFTGSRGLVTELVSAATVVPERTIAVVVGPPVMYRPAIELLRAKGLDGRRIVVSLERQMRCGTGKCGHCTIDHLYCCQDGPVFWLDQVEGLRGAL